MKAIKLFFILFSMFAGNAFASSKVEKKVVFFASLYELKEKLRDSDFKILKKILSKTSIIEGLKENNYYRSDFIVKRGEEQSGHFQHLKIYNQKGLELYEILFLKKYETFYINTKDSSGNSKKEIFLKMGYVREQVDNSFRLGLPLSGIKYISSGFQKRRLHPIYKVFKEHNGIDLVANFGSDVRAAMNGVVTKIGVNGGYGRYIEISNMGGKYKTEYGHLNSYGKAISLGSVVSEGDKIGEMGNSGVSTGPHLHFGLKISDTFVDPRGYIKSRKKAEIKNISDEDMTKEYKRNIAIHRLIKEIIKSRVV